MEKYLRALEHIKHLMTITSQSNDDYVIKRLCLNDYVAQVDGVIATAIYDPDITMDDFGAVHAKAQDVAKYGRRWIEDCVTKEARGK